MANVEKTSPSFKKIQLNEKDQSDHVNTEEERKSLKKKITSTTNFTASEVTGNDDKKSDRKKKKKDTNFQFNIEIEL